MNKGTLYAVGAYTLWGLLPLFWKALANVPALEILSHRIVWSLAFLALLQFVRRSWPSLRRDLRRRRELTILGGAALLLGVNWYIYIWAVNAGFVVETSLGYFINPLFSVFLGAVLLHERLRPLQWAAVSLAAAGVLYLTFSYGALPWIALTLAFTFGVYGLLKKQAPFSALNGLTLETAVLVLPALGYITVRQAAGAGALGTIDATTTALLIATGIATGLPLLLFAAGARRIRLSTLGILQYIAPTMQFLLGIFLYREPFTAARLLGFAVIWLALALYSVENLVIRRRTAALEPQTGVRHV